jgi:hypothetical protein
MGMPKIRTGFRQTCPLSELSIEGKVKYAQKYGRGFIHTLSIRHEGLVEGNSD